MLHLPHDVREGRTSVHGKLEHLDSFTAGLPHLSLADLYIQVSKHS